MKFQLNTLYKNVLGLLLLLSASPIWAQQFNNEWIRYDQTYYKFNVGAKGLYKISRAALEQAGIGTAAVENLELWRNGKPVPFYPSVPAGPLPENGYLEFWGEPNDGEADAPLYRNPANQHTKDLSLISDTSVYFLSVNTNRSGFVVTESANDVASNTLPAEPWFMHKLKVNYKSKINPGYAVIVGEYIYSSSYDIGEFWSSADTRPSGVLRNTSTGLQVYSSGPDARLEFGAFGNALNTRNIEVKLNDVTLKDTIMDYFSEMKTSVTFPVSLIATNSAKTEFYNRSPVGTDRLVVSYFSIDYPRTFNFSNLRNFEFTLPGKQAGYYLEITNFNYGNVAPVLYDLTTGIRKVGNIAQTGRVRFALPGFSGDHKFVLVNQQAPYSTTITSLEPKTFKRFDLTENQGDYLIITHPSLYNGTNGRNPVEDYAAYRRSAVGGNHDVSVVDINELVDQFAFGIKKHPLSIKNFLRYARSTYAKPLRFVFLIGRGMAYNEYNINQKKPEADLLNLVPSFGYPASDNLLSSASASSPIAETPIGRLSVVNAAELENYLEKVLEYELVQRTAGQTVEEKGWMKNVVHVTGSSEPYLGTVLCNYMNVYGNIIRDTLFGAKVHSFCKVSTTAIEHLSTEKIKNLFEEGISILTYFGHSSSTTLEFNLDNPQAYNNSNGKYPVFFVNGCNAGNFYTYNIQRLMISETLSEKFVLAKKKGSIAFVASTHFGIVNYLNLYLNKLYGLMGRNAYGSTLGEVNRDALKAMVETFGNADFYSRAHAEEITIHGDPAIKLHTEEKPDYVVEKPFLKLNPSIVSIADNVFEFRARLINLGKAVSDSVMVEIKRQYPDGSMETVYRQKREGMLFEDSVVLEIPIVATRDKGENKFFVTIDPDQQADEITRANNSASIDFFIFEEEARPVYPFPYAIVNDPVQTFYASSANPFSAPKEYIFEIDTTELFNSTLKVTRTVSTAGGVIEFNPTMNFTDSTVYYWRVAPEVPEGKDYVWNGSSFIYLKESTPGWNQSHFYQHARNTYTDIIQEDDGRFEFDTVVNNLILKSSLYPYGQNTAFFKGDPLYDGGCGTYINSLEFVIYDLKTGKYQVNHDQGSEGSYRSLPATCALNGIRRDMFFFFYYNNADYRKRAMDFLDSVKNGSIITLMNWGSMTYNSNPRFINDWQKDTLLYGSNNSIYHKLMQIGLTEIDSFYRNIPFMFIFKKDFEGNYSVIHQSVGRSSLDMINGSVNFTSHKDSGTIASALIGPARNWKSIHWNGQFRQEHPNNKVEISLYGVNEDGDDVLVYRSNKQVQDTALNTISAETYPFMRFEMKTIDKVNYTPFQLNYWQVKYDEMPEGAVDPKLNFSFKDTVDVGEPINFKVAFRNISNADFDSLKYRLVITDQRNVQQFFNPSRAANLPKGDSVTLNYQIDTRTLAGSNTAFVEVNPNEDQPEQFHSNNFFYRDFYVRPDFVKPVLDVTFDGIHILNRDLVSAKPHIRIKIQDESKYMLLNDTTLADLEVRFPDGTVRTYAFDNDTLRFTPASSGEDNSAMIDFRPDFSTVSMEGEDYELIVKGRDLSGNKAGEIDYRVGFKVISKPMISNMLNYPNPFSTSTAFVFTVTGHEVPQNLKIQIMTVTGKIVREITKEELGPIHIGRNITEFKWDGTDQFGQKLANGVYLYRMVATMNGQRMEKYKAEGDTSDRFFNNGYGKMYLMR